MQRFYFGFTFVITFLREDISTLCNKGRKWVENESSLSRVPSAPSTPTRAEHLTLARNSFSFHVTHRIFFRERLYVSKSDGYHSKKIKIPTFSKKKFFYLSGFFSYQQKQIRVFFLKLIYNSLMMLSSLKKV